MKRPLLFLCVFLLLLLPLAAHAQTPDSINTVLADLSQRVGQNVTLDMLENFTFEEQIFPDTSLGCPQPGLSYLQVQTRGVQYTLAYQSVVYDYRIASDGTNLILCNEDEVVPPCPPPDVVGYLPPRLTVGLQAKVGVGGVPNNVRELPGSSSRLLGEIPSEAAFTVLDGPTCSTLDKVVWWKVDYNGLVGWTAESKDGEYYLEPIVLPGTLVPTAPPLPTATALPNATSVPAFQPITPANAAQLVQVSSPEITTGVYALSASGELLVIGGDDGTITFVDLETNTYTMPVPMPSSAITALLYAVDSMNFRHLLITGTADGAFEVWEVGNAQTLTSLFINPAQAGAPAVTQLAFNQRDQFIAVGDAAGNIRLFDTTGALLTTLTGGTSPITTLEFSVIGKTIISTDEAGALRVWGIPTSAG